MGVRARGVMHRDGKVFLRVFYGRESWLVGWGKGGVLDWWVFFLLLNGWVGLVWFGLVWFGLVWFGLVWFGLVWFGLVWFGLMMSERV